MIETRRFQQGCQKLQVHAVCDFGGDGDSVACDESFDPGLGPGPKMIRL